jgi:hypothetical protein
MENNVASSLKIKLTIITIRKFYFSAYALKNWKQDKNVCTYVCSSVTYHIQKVEVT